MGTDHHKPHLILASASPRRLDLLAQIGVVPFAVDPAHINEHPTKNELPVPHAKRLAEEKARAVAQRHPEAQVLGADTVVACGRRILPKAETVEQARFCLELLSGRKHRVHSGVCLIAPDGTERRRLVTTSVTFKRLSKSELDAYIDCGEWQGKAGGYAIQGHAAAFVRQISGSYTNVVGLPLFEVAALLEASHA